jgi:hypothetical protein
MLAMSCSMHDDAVNAKCSAHARRKALRPGQGRHTPPPSELSRASG